MGDLRSTWRFVAPSLVQAGYRVAVMELRGHGDSDTTFVAYDDPSAAGDVLALIDELGGPAIVVGHSMGAAAAVIAAADRADLVSGLALVGPFVREPALNPLVEVAFRLAMARPWARQVWKSYLPKLYAGRRPEDFQAHRDAMIEAMARPGHTKAFSRTTRTSHQPAADVIATVSVPALVLMGELDNDFPSPAAEAEWIAGQLTARVVMVPEAGHYPHSQRPDIVVPEIIALAASVFPRA